ncbi:MAG: PqqD family protein [Butyricicoccus pullicaecorum]|nr:PqqD family protein [Butyricicoccus pullicaecorum]
MKIKQGFLLRRMADQFVVVAVGAAAQEFPGMMRLNGSGAFIWKQLEREVDENAVIRAVLEEYDVPEEQAAADVRRWIAQLRETGALDG